jgi:hypothetical protein
MAIATEYCGTLAACSARTPSVVPNAPAASDAAKGSG